MSKIRELQWEKASQMDRPCKPPIIQMIIRDKALAKYRSFLDSCSDEEWEVLREEGLVNE